MTTDDAVEQLCLPPRPVPNQPGALLKDYRITRIAKVRMHWNDAEGDWEWEPLDGVSNYYTAIERSKAEGKA